MRKGVRGQATEKPDILEVLRFYGAELPHYIRGNWTPMKCCFHDDSVASAQVRADEGGKFNCFVCGISGDGLDIIMDREGVGFAVARSLAEERHGTIRGGMRDENRGRRSLFDGSGNHETNGNSGASRGLF